VTYLSAVQHAKLLEPINPGRVGKDGKGFSHVEAYEIRAHLNRIFGFGRWSADLTDLALVFETSARRRKKNKAGEEYGDPYEAWTTCYRATLRLAVQAPDGTPLVTYTEAATGTAENQPSRADAHDLSIKTAESQAMKRCAANLGDQFGLSLYRKGSVAGLVRLSLVGPDGAESAAPAVTPAPIDAHVTESVPESEQVEDTRDTNDKKPVEQPRDTAHEEAAAKREAAVAAFRAELLAAPKDADARWFARKQLEATTGGFLKALVEDRDNNVITVGAFIQQEQKRAKGAAA
jgi:recombination DNA repair RAD52 pathway protein